MHFHCSSCRPQQQFLCDLETGGRRRPADRRKSLPALTASGISSQCSPRVLAEQARASSDNVYSFTWKFTTSRNALLNHISFACFLLPTYTTVFPSKTSLLFLMLVSAIPYLLTRSSNDTDADMHLVNTLQVAFASDLRARVHAPIVIGEGKIHDRAPTSLPSPPPLPHGRSTQRTLLRPPSPPPNLPSDTATAEKMAAHGVSHAAETKSRLSPGPFSQQSQPFLPSPAVDEISSLDSGGKTISTVTAATPPVAKISTHSTCDGDGGFQAAKAAAGAGTSDGALETPQRRGSWAAGFLRGAAPLSPTSPPNHARLPRSTSGAVRVAAAAALRSLEAAFHRCGFRLSAVSCISATLKSGEGLVTQIPSRYVISARHNLSCTIFCLCAPLTFSIFPISHLSISPRINNLLLSPRIIMKFQIYSRPIKSLQWRGTGHCHRHRRHHRRHQSLLALHLPACILLQSTRTPKPGLPHRKHSRPTSAIVRWLSQPLVARGMETAVRQRLLAWGRPHAALPAFFREGRCCPQ